MSMSAPMSRRMTSPMSRRMDDLLPGNAIAPFTSLLSTSIGVAGAYGISLMIPAYTGSCVDLKRVSDNATATYGLVNGRIDPAAAAWVSGTTAWITKFYDQSGNGNHLTEATLANCAVFSANAMFPEGVICHNQSADGVMLHTIPGTLSVGARNFSVGFFGTLQGHQTQLICGFLGASGNQLNLYVSSGMMRIYDSVNGGINSTVVPHSYPDAIFFESSGTTTYFEADVDSQTGGSLPVATYTGGQFGTGYTGGGGWYLCSTGFAIFSTALGSVERAAIRSRLKSRYSVPATFTGLDFLPIGDSLTAGYGSDGRSWPVQFLQARGGIATNHWVSASASGAYTSTMAGFSLSGFYKATCSRHVCVLLGGTNDLRVGVTPATSLANIATVKTNANAAGYNEFFVCTVPAGSGVNETDRATLNTSIRSTYGANVVDLAADSRLSNTADTTYYLPDALHFNTVGYGVFASLINAKVG